MHKSFAKAIGESGDRWNKKISKCVSHKIIEVVFLLVAPILLLSVEKWTRKSIVHHPTLCRLVSPIVKMTDPPPHPIKGTIFRGGGGALR